MHVEMPGWDEQVDMALEMCFLRGDAGWILGNDAIKSRLKKNSAMLVGEEPELSVE